MLDRKRVVRVAAVLVIAGATGHLMQYGGAAAGRFVPEGLTPVPGDGPLMQVTGLSAPRDGDPRGLSFIPGADEVRAQARPPRRLAEPEALRLAALDTRTDAGGPMLPALAAPQAGTGCEATLVAAPREAALVQLTLDAPCHPQSRVELRHGMLELVAVTDAAGRLEMVIPALAVSAEFTARLDGLPALAAATEVTALSRYHRVAIVWAGVGDLELHAFENGAQYGAAGHVWSGAPGDPASSAGGFAMRLGHPDDPVPLMAEVYTVPADSVDNLRLTVESRVDRDSCGLDLAGHAVHVTQGASADPVQIVLAMPHCDSAGSVLVLDGVFPELALAAR
jgi:hypothetical protein